MAHSIEVRAPFEDHRLVELAASIPLSRRLGLRDGKRLLRRAFAGDLPREVLERPKWGWMPPFYHWLRLGLEEGLLRDVLSLAAVRETGFLDPAGAISLLDGSLPLERVHLRLWNLLHLVLWSREVVGAAR